MLLSAAAAAQQQQMDANAAAAAAFGSLLHSQDANAVLTMNAAAILAAHALSTASPMWSHAGSNGSQSSFGTPTAFSPTVMGGMGAHHSQSASSASHGGFQAGGFQAGGFQAAPSSGLSSYGGPTSMAPQPKRYSHNPYASDPSTPTTPHLGASFSGGSTAMQTTAMGSDAAYIPTSAANGMGMGFGDMAAAAGGHHHHFGGGDGSGMLPHGPNMAMGVNEQFMTIKGSLPSAACTARGRHILIATIRLQQADKLQAILDELLPAFASIVADGNGSHVVRTLFEHLSEEQSAALMQSLSADAIMALATSSQHSRRILQSALERHRATAATTLQGVVDVIARQALVLATTQQGCIAVMRVVENATDSQKKQILQTVRAAMPTLTTDPFGNYVVQTLIQHLPRDIASEVIDKAFEGQFVAMCCNKFASNVMEKIVHAATPPTRKIILEEVCYNNANLQVVMQDGFGNFVLQSIIDTCTTGCEYRRLCDRIRPLLSCSPYGHKIEAKLRSKRFNTHGNN